jgi:threonine synthase
VNFSARFRCFAGCGASYPLTEVRLRCGGCGGLLDVEHDIEALRRYSGAKWRELFDARRLHPGWPEASGVWGKREWVLPELRDEEIVSLGEGHTALVPLPRLGEALGVRDVWIKQCGHNPTGSFKDLGMTALVSMVQALRRRGVPVPAVACASTGDTSAALAAYGAAAGVPTIVFLPAGQLSDEQLAQPLSSYALTAALDTDFDGCMELVAAFCGRHGVYLANSMNPLRIEGQKTLSVEICQQLGWRPPDWVVVPGGNLGHATALGKGFELMRELGVIDRVPRLCVAQAERAAPLYRAFRDGWRFQPLRAEPTQASAIRIGRPVNAPKAIALLQRLDGVVEAASEDEITAAWTLGDRYGLYADPHTGVALAGLRKQVASGTIKPHERVVVVSTAHGLKFGALKREYHVAAASDGKRNPPLRLPASLEALDQALLPRLRP